MHIRVVVLVKIPKGFDHRARFLRSRSTIKINQRMAVRLFVKKWEIFATGVPIYSADSRLVHTIICYTWRRAPLYSDAIITHKQRVICVWHASSRPGGSVGRFLYTASSR